MEPNQAHNSQKEGDKDKDKDKEKDKDKHKDQSHSEGETDNTEESLPFETEEHQHQEHHGQEHHNAAVPTHVGHPPPPTPAQEVIENLHQIVVVEAEAENAKNPTPKEEPIQTEGPNAVQTLLAPPTDGISSIDSSRTTLADADTTQSTKSHRSRSTQRSMGYLVLEEKSRMSETEKSVAEEIDLLAEVMEEDRKSSLSPSPSWEGFMASEIGMDPDIAMKHGKHMDAKKIRIDKKLLKDLQSAHPGDEKRQMAFIEEVLASYHMKELTNRYGSGAKGKSEKQYFMEAYETEARLDSLERPGEKDFHHGRKYDDKNDDNRSVFDNNGRCSPIVFQSLVSIPEDDATQKQEVMAVQEGSTVNFWAALERQQRREAGGSDDSLPTCSLSGVSYGSYNLEPKGDVDEQSEMPSNDYDRGAPEESPVEEALLDKYLERSQEQEVMQSEAVRRAWSRVLEHIKQFSLQDPLAYDMYGKTYEEVRDFVKLPEEDVREFEAGNWAQVPMRDKDIFTLEPPEKLIARFSVYQKAMMYLAEHFETLRPLLAEIKQAYEDVLEKCEKEWKDLDEDRLEHLRLKEAYATHVRKTNEDGDKAILQVKVQAHALQQHLKCQQDTVHTVLGVLAKVRQSLKEQKQVVEDLLLIHNAKADSLDKEVVTVEEPVMYEVSLPEKFADTMEQFDKINDPKEVRRILQAARRQLRKAHKQIVIFEADYADSVPRAQYEIYKKKHSIIHDKNQIVIDKSNEMKAEIERANNNILDKKRQMFEEAGLKWTGGLADASEEDTEADSLMNEDEDDEEEEEEESLASFKINA